MRASFHKNSSRHEFQCHPTSLRHCPRPSDQTRNRSDCPEGRVSRLALISSRRAAARKARLKQQTFSKCASSGAGRKCLSLQHERAVIPNADFCLRRSRPRGGCNRVGPPQEETQRRAYVDAGYDVRWNADHHAGHGMPETRLLPQGSRKPRARNAPGSPRAEAAVLTSRQFNAHHRWRCPSPRRLPTFRRLSTTPASGSSNLTSLFHLTGAWGTIPQIATTTYATISPDSGSVPLLPGRPLISVYGTSRHFAATQQFGRFRSVRGHPARTSVPSTYFPLVVALGLSR